ncbi:MAG TPA: uracil-DNA glycosylase [Candidatus Paenibacillus intestinavium]|nr:uracil-DNA glycosylase [Candidatus Paenibacillus intestinavium]
MQLPNNQWGQILQAEYNKSYFEQLLQFINLEYEQHIIYPSKNQIFHALQLTDYDKTRVVILGQDPYHGEGQAQGLAFSVENHLPLPPSLRNIMKERFSDVAIADSGNGSLEKWAKQGVLLLNTVLTVRAGEANSHQKKGWELFTDAIITKLSNKEEPLIFVLWGKPAQHKKQLIAPHHIIVESVHPSPLAAYRGFFGSKPFSKINEHLNSLGHQPIDWSN